jgi:methylenetetrahydrofolate reductase (NADPH)
MEAKGIQEKVSIMVSIGVIDSVENARDIHRRFPGVLIPESILDRLDGSAPGRQRQEGLQIAVETIQKLRENPLVSGINIVTHLSSTTFDEIVELCGQSNLLQRPILETPRKATNG